MDYITHMHTHGHTHSQPGHEGLNGYRHVIMSAAFVDLQLCTPQARIKCDGGRAQKGKVMRPQGPLKEKSPGLCGWC